MKINEVLNHKVGSKFKITREGIENVFDVIVCEDGLRWAEIVVKGKPTWVTNEPILLSKENINADFELIEEEEIPKEVIDAMEWLIKRGYDICDNLTLESINLKTLDTYRK